jgi:hypoxanthine phosphoribosyltransferase
MQFVFMNRIADKTSVQVHGRDFEPMLTPEEVQVAVRRLAGQLSTDFGHGDPLCLSVLNGAFIFAADLVRAMDFDPEIRFIKVASYQHMESSGKINELIGLDTDVSGRDIIIVEDIVDTGHTITHLKRMLRERNAARVVVAALLWKEEAYLYNEPIEYVGFSIPNRFVIGYGLDFNGHGRALDGIYVLREE